eukprot:gnl/Hemi2/2543_TR904_c0_g1_i1.p1 gnl/Hemi2/2543_TR904_c0_g1~~gnl/Hemi2/2543_TR904_c0_g1_i1.p1  ORF type:complete len:327 (+),score=33.79 gnl/Hemi2/2543_TR904_c0_g1_i1:48-1028(+)
MYSPTGLPNTDIWVSSAAAPVLVTQSIVTSPPSSQYVTDIYSPLDTLTVLANGSSVALDTSLPQKVAQVGLVSENEFIGSFAGAAIAGGSYNQALGFGALGALTSGSSNVAVGSGALSNATTDSQNVAVGRNALGSQTGGLVGNVAVGASALSALASAGANNTAVGSSAMVNAGATSNNVAVGTSALAVAGPASDGSTAVGSLTLTNVTTGGGNTGVGFQVGSSINHGVNNTLVGSGADTGGDSNDNTVIGLNASAGGFSGCLVLGAGAAATANAQLAVGSAVVPLVTGSTVGTAGPAAPIPASPSLYLYANVNGTNYAIPCFAAP